MSQFKLVFYGCTVYCSDKRLAQVKFIDLEGKQKQMETENVCYFIIMKKEPFIWMLGEPFFFKLSLPISKKINLHCVIKLKFKVCQEKTEFACAINISVVSRRDQNLCHHLVSHLTYYIKNALVSSHSEVHKFLLYIILKLLYRLSQNWNIK